MNPTRSVNPIYAAALPTCFALAGCFLQAGAQAQDKKSTSPAKAAGANAAAQKEARDALSKFDKEWSHGNRRGAWKVRMQCLQTLVKGGAGAVPVILEALKTGSNQHRAFAAQALGLIADPSTRPALLEAAKEKDRFVREHAFIALAKLGRQEATPLFRHIAEKDTSDTARFLMAYALTRDDTPDPAPIRQALIDYDLTRMGSARKGQAAPDFALSDTQGKTWRLSQLRGKQSVVLVFLMTYC